MTRVNFYILSVDDLQQRLTFACRLTEKALNSGHQVYLHTGSENAAQELDQLLWSFNPSSFVPHGLLSNAESTHESVQIGWQNSPGRHHDVLINLTADIPEFFSRFDRVSEVVTQESQCRSSGRDRFKFYRDRGYPLETHKI